MNNILIVGIGRCSYPMIEYLDTYAKEYGWFVTLADIDMKRTNFYNQKFQRVRGTWLDVTKANDRRDLMQRFDLVISLLPAHLHLDLAQDCLMMNKPVVTSSFISRELFKLGDRVRGPSLDYAVEVGFDPGFDHILAKEMLDELKEDGAQINAFELYKGDIINNVFTKNPWKFKFTRNPRNVILMGKGTAQFLENNKMKFLPHNRLYDESIKIDLGIDGQFDAYMDRNSILHRRKYGLNKIPNIKKFIIVPDGFCRAWSALVKIGLTDRSYPILKSKDMTYHSYLNSFLDERIEGITLKQRVANFLNIDVDDDIIVKMEWLGLFKRTKIGINYATPALILEHLCVQKWELNEGEKDTVLCHIKIDYELNGQRYLRTKTSKLIGSGKPIRLWLK